MAKRKPNVPGPKVPAVRIARPEGRPFQLRYTDPVEKREVSRRSCGERLRDAGVPPLLICRVMRHSSWETTRKHYAPGNIQNDAEVLWSVLAAKKIVA